MFFIVSTGRSGTTTIAKTLSLVNGCVCLHEPAPELILESSDFHYGDLSSEMLKEILLDTRKPILDGSVYCESNQTLSLMIPVLKETFPEARYIWLMRNGLDVVASTYQKQWYTGHSENHERYEDCSLIEKAWIDGRIRGDRCGDISPTEWESLDRFGKCCWYWGYANRVIERDLNKYAPGGFFILHLEEIDEKIGGLIDWMGLKVAVTPLARQHNIAKKVPFHWTDWSAEERKIFERFCGQLMDRLYPSWRTSSGVWKGLDYRPTTGFFGSIRRNHKLVKWLNNMLTDYIK